MVRNKYLEILELKPGATEKDVKSAYRRLSKVYHPDISKDPKAKENFIRINEAYNFLTKVGPSPQKQTVPYNYNPEAERYKKWRKMAREKARKRAREEARLEEEMIKKTLKVLNLVLVFVIVFNAILAIDYLLPATKHKQEIRSIEKVFERTRRSTFYSHDKVTFTDFFMRFEKEETELFTKYDNIIVETTPLLHVPMKMHGTYKGTTYLHEQLESIFTVYWYGVPFIFGALFMYKYRSRTWDMKLRLSIFTVFIFIAQVFSFSLR